MGRRPCAFLLTLLSVGSATASPPQPLRLCYEDVPQSPWTMPDGGGLNLELLRRVEKQLNENLVFLPMPWKRCIDNVHWGTVDAVIGSADTPERRADGKLPTVADGHTDPTAALDVESYNIFLRTNGDARWDGKTLLVPRGSVIVPRGYIVAQALRDKGYPVQEAVKSAEEGLRMLAEGAADVAVLFGLEAEDLARTPRFRDKVKEVGPAFMTMPFYLLVSHASYQRDPQRFEAIWNSIRAVRMTVTYRQLEDGATRRTPAEANRSP